MMETHKRRQAQQITTQLTTSDHQNNHAMSQSPAGSQLDYDWTIYAFGVRDLAYMVAISRRGLSSITTRQVFETWNSITQAMSQSPAGSQLDSDERPIQPPGSHGTTSRNPPQSLSSIPTVDAISRRNPGSRRCRNPPQGLSSIPTCSARTVERGRLSRCRNPPQGLSSIPTEALRDDVLLPLNVSQSPAGSQLDSDAKRLRP